jgi:hypothetical protein
VIEGLLHSLAALGVQAGMIRRGGEVSREFGRHALGLLPGGRIHDARPALPVQQ